MSDDIFSKRPEGFVPTETIENFDFELLDLRLDRDVMSIRRYMSL